MLKSLNLPSVKRLPLLVFVNKGIEIGTNKLPLEVIAEAANDEIARVSTFLVRPLVLELKLFADGSWQSGPSFANEIVRRQPTQVSVASSSITHAEATARLFHQPHFRC
jgi:glycerol-3-phosphate dehydrogenase